MNQFNLKGGEYVEDRVPDSLAVLVSEMHHLGESMIRKVIKRFSISDPDNDGEMIEFESLIDLIGLFKYNCMFSDR
jgi:hypothetical protein